MRRALGLALLSTACGRVGFAPNADATGLTDDVLADGLPDGAGDAQFACSDVFALCDTFDDAALDTSKWNVAGIIERDTAIKHRGSSSLRMTTPSVAASTEAHAYIWHQGAPITTSSTIWMRAWMRTDALPAGTNAVEMIALQQASALGNYVFVHAADTRLYDQFDNMSAQAGVAPPTDTWFCMVWKVVLSTSATGLSAFSSDVIPAMTVTGSITQGTPAIDVVAFGPYFAPTNVDVAQPGVSVWVDDVIVHTAQLTCND
jgi:hypothetical protein